MRVYVHQFNGVATMNVLANFGIRPRDIDIVRHLIGRGPGTPDSRSLALLYARTPMDCVTLLVPQHT